MKEIDKINLFIQFLITTSRFESQEEVGKHIGYPNKSSFSQMLKKELTPIFREKFFSAFPEFNNFYVGFIDNVDSASIFNEKDSIIETQKNFGIEEFEQLKNELKSQREENIKNTQKIIEFVDEYLKPVFDFMQESLENKKKDNIQ